MLYRNPAARKAAYPEELRAIMSMARAGESRSWLASWPGINSSGTPLYALPGIARQCGVGQVFLKDEAERSGLGSFKALGAPIALVRLILRRWPERRFQPSGLFAGQYRRQLEDFTVTSATDGNHGRALAAAASAIGCQCVIVLHANVSAEREEAIARYGARIVRIPGNYDDSVAEAARLAQCKGWEVVSDTSYEGYEEIPRDVMQGYAVIAAEIVGAMPSSGLPCPFSHVVLQGGVGGLAAGVLGYFWETYGENRPFAIVVEPGQADCLYQSALAGKASQATGTVDSLMAGLACGETSPLAWRFLHGSADFFLKIGDDDALEAMRILADGRHGDIPLVAGESGAAGLAALNVLSRSRELASQALLDTRSRVLLVNTEGATAPSLYEQLAGASAQAVHARRQAWTEKPVA